MIPPKEKVMNENKFNFLLIGNIKWHTVVEAISRQLGHCAYHIGQIVYIGKMIRGSKWTSLSIPKGKSKEVNAEKFSQPKHKQYFTDEFLNDKK